MQLEHTLGAEGEAESGKYGDPSGKVACSQSAYWARAFYAMNNEKASKDFKQKRDGYILHVHGRLQREK